MTEPDTRLIATHEFRLADLGEVDKPACINCGEKFPIRILREVYQAGLGLGPAWKASPSYTGIFRCLRKVKASKP